MAFDDIDPMNLVNRFYLPNKLEVILISNLENSLSTVSFGLDLGSYFDPDEYFGFSKLLSCVSQYIETPDKNFTRMVDSIQTKHQSCITYYWIPQSSDTAIEFSGIFSSECLDEYLERIRKSLDVVDYSEEVISKCLGMLKKEYEIESNSGIIQRNAILRSVFDSRLRNPLSTKKNYTISDLVKEVKKFKEKYYSSNIMKLVIESSLTLEYLVDLTEKHFSTIPNLETDVKEMRYNIGLNYLLTDNISRSLIEYNGIDNKISLIFVLDSEKGSIIGSKRIPIFEYLVKHYFCGEFSGSLKSAISPLNLTCNVEYYAERLTFVWLDVESEGGNIALEEILELVYSSVMLLRKTKIKRDYFEFLVNHCIANYMNYDLFDFKINIQDRISSLINYNVWNKLERYCGDSGYTIEELNQIINFLDIENLLVLINSNQFNYLISSNYEYYDDFVENTTEINEIPNSKISFYSNANISVNGENFDKFSLNKTIYHQSEKNVYQYQYQGPLLNTKYNIRRISPNLIKRLKSTKESFGIISGLSRPFINPYTPKDFKLVDFVWEKSPFSKVFVNYMGIEMRSNPFKGINTEAYPSKFLLYVMGNIFTAKTTQENHLALSEYHDTQISIFDNVNIWYKARNDKRQPYFKGLIRLNSPSKSFKLVHLILSFILVISIKSILNISLIQDAKFSLTPKNGPEYSSISPSLDFHISGYSSSLSPILKTISTTLNSEEIISETFFNDSKLVYKGLLMNRKQSMTSELKARELSWRITIPKYPSLGRQYFGLNQINYQQLKNVFKKFKENLCIDGLFVGNLDRVELEELMKDFTSKFSFKAKREQCRKLLTSKSLPIKDVRGTIYKRMIYHYIRPDPLDLTITCNNSTFQQKGIKRFNSKASIENLFKLLNEECGQINCTNETIRSGYLDFKTNSNEFGPNIALLDIIIYNNKNNKNNIKNNRNENSQDFKLKDIDIGILYLNDAYYNIMWFKESLRITNASLTLKTSVEKYDNYYKWSIQLKSWKYSANDLGLYISQLTNNYQNILENNIEEDYKVVKNLTITKLKNKLIKYDIDEEFNSHKYNLGYSESIIEELENLSFNNFTSKMSSILRDQTLFLLIQVQSTSNNELLLTLNSQNLKSSNKNRNRFKFSKNRMISIPSGYKYIKHIDELVQDDRIPTISIDSEEAGFP